MTISLVRLRGRFEMLLVVVHFFYDLLTLFVSLARQGVFESSALRRDRLCVPG
jgi:hypothetical protein